MLCRGHQLLADDLTAITTDGQEALTVHPAVPELKASQQSIEHFRLESAPQRPFPSSDEMLLRCEQSFCEGPQELRAIYLLERATGAQASLLRVPPSQAVAEILRNFFGANTVGKATLGLPAMMRQASQIAEAVRVRILRVVDNLDCLDEAAELVEKDVRAS
jgi:hypothetical protein